MNNEQTTNDIPIDPMLIERINHLSGAHSALFWDVLYGTSESLIAVENTEAVLDFLYSHNYSDEAFTLIRAYYELLGIDWPEEMKIIEQVHQLKEPFVLEFLLDAQDLIIDFEYENNISN